MIYFDNAATTRPSEHAISAMLSVLRDDYGNPSSQHSAGQSAAGLLFAARRKVASILGAAANEIFFTSGGCEGNTMALISAAEYGGSQGKRHIISQQTEHHSVLECLKSLERRGFEVTLLPVDSEGRVSVGDVSAAIRSDTALVSIMTANNEIGTIQPVSAIGQLCREKGVLFHTDAVQAAGVLPLDVKKLCCDMLTLSAHKFHGPKGAGALYVRTGVPVTQLIFGTQERGRRGGTENLPAIMGMSASLADAVSIMPIATERTAALRDALIEGIAALPDTYLNGPRYDRLCGNVSFCFGNITGERLVYELSRRDICASSGSACSSGMSEPSRVMLAIGRSTELAKGALRLSLSALSTADEVEAVLSAIRDIIYSL